MARGWPKGVSRKQHLQEKEAMAKIDVPPQDPNLVSIDKDQLAALMGRLDSLEKKTAKGQGVETAVQRLSKVGMYQEPDPIEIQAKIHVVDEPATKGSIMLFDICPFCKKFHPEFPTKDENGKIVEHQSILDFTGASKYQCRRCGKSWYPWALGISNGRKMDEAYEYSEALETGNRKRVDQQERIKMAKAGLPVSSLIADDDVED